MRTKTLLLTAALTAAGTLASMAQVYSVNMVGYINLQIPQGFSLIANQLNNGSLNQLAELIPTPPDTTQFYKYNNAAAIYQLDDYTDGVWEGDTSGTMTMNPGEGLFINAAQAFTATFVGEVQLVSDTSIYPGFNIVSSAIPQQGLLQTDLGFPQPEDKTFFYQYNNAGKVYFPVNDFTDLAWEGDDGGNEPTLHVGEAMFVYNQSANTMHWTRTFSVSGN